MISTLTVACSLVALLHPLTCPHVLLSPAQCICRHKDAHKYLEYRCLLLWFCHCRINVYKVTGRELNACYQNHPTVIQHRRVSWAFVRVCTRQMFRAACQAASSILQLILSLDTLTDWQVREILNACVCVFVFSCVWTEGGMLCLQQINVSLEGMWNLRQRWRETDKDGEGDGASPGQTHLLSSPFPIRAPSFRVYTHFERKLCKFQKQTVVMLKLAPVRSYKVIRVKELFIQT